MRRGRSVVYLCLVALGCSESTPGPLARDPVEDQAEVLRLTQQLAAAISQRDAQGVARAMPLDSSIVYISDGAVIRGVDLIPTLDAYYGGVDSLEFEWTDQELSFPTPETAVMIGWASIRARVGDGEWIDDPPAIFTSLLRSGEAGHWEFVTTHKTSMGR